MFKNILLIIEESEEFDKALECALKVVQPKEGKVVGLCVIDSTWSRFIGSDFLSSSTARKQFLEYIAQDLKEQAADRIEKFKAALAAKGVPCEVRIRDGEQAEEIMKEIESSSYDLVVTGAKQLKGLARLRDTKTAKLVREAPLPVLVVR